MKQKIMNKVKGVKVTRNLYVQLTSINNILNELYLFKISVKRETLVKIKLHFTVTILNMSYKEIPVD